MATNLLHIRLDPMGYLRDEHLSLLEEDTEFIVAATIWRMVAPYRLVEFEYVGENPLKIGQVYISFPDYDIYLRDDAIPDEEAVEMAAKYIHGQNPGPIYVHVCLQEAIDQGAALDYLKELSFHVCEDFSAFFKDNGEWYRFGNYEGEIEAARMPSEAEIIQALQKRLEAAGGKPCATITLMFAKRNLEFSSFEARDDFVFWYNLLREWVFTPETGWSEIGVDDLAQAAMPSLPILSQVGENGGVHLKVYMIESPSEYQNGKAWTAFGGKGRQSALSYAQARLLPDFNLDRSFAIATEYWRYVKNTIIRLDA